jgi:hypothetical protein
LIPLIFPLNINIIINLQKLEIIFGALIMQEIRNEVYQKEIPYFRIFESQNLSDIENALNSTLFVPEPLLKTRIIQELLDNLKAKYSDEVYPITSFIASNENGICGMVICQVDPHYTSYSRKCGTFGWIHAESLDICEGLMKNCAKFVREHRIRKLRGPINCPKSLGGLGHQVEGFKEQILYSVAYDDPNSQVLDYLTQLGYVKESQYSCVRVEKKTWDNGKQVSNDIRLGYADLEGIINLKEQILNLGKNSFHSILPDASGRDERFNDFVNAYSQIPEKTRKLPSDFNFEEYSTNPHFIEAWENVDLRKIEMYAPMAFDRHSNELVGILFTLPDLFEVWAGKNLTRNNVDTAMVRKDYTGRGIFSALNNIGQLTCRFYGIEYFEGTTIWSNNTKAIEAIFPHCSPIRKHYVVQKRI